MQAIDLYVCVDVCVSSYVCPCVLQTERNIFTTNGGTGPFHSRWKFNPSFLPWAADFDRTGGFFERKTLKNIMTFNWRGNKVAAADRVTGA